jgi:hypothetical protein
MHLARFKEAGLIKFERTLQIPMAERIPALVRDSGHLDVLTAIVASLKSALDNINLKRGLTEDQVIELAEVIIDQSHEDQLALEDILLFLSRLITGQAGTLYDRLDMPTFFELFESYREERYQALRHIRDEQHVNYKCLGDNTRLSHVVDAADEDYRQALANHYKKQYNEESGNKPTVSKEEGQDL